MVTRIRANDWSKTPLGPLESWPANVRTALAICLNSRFPILLWIGPRLHILYNDAYIPFLGPAKHPAMLGAPGREAWGEIWSSIGPMHDEVASGRATFAEDFQFFFDRSLPSEEVYVTFSYSPIFDDDGKTVLGVFCTCTETTDKIVRQRRLSILRRLGVRITEAGDEEAACRQIAAILEDDPWDIPFAAIYLNDHQHGTAHRAALVRVAPETAAFPAVLSLSGTSAASAWPLAEALRTHDLVECRLLEEGVAALPMPPWGGPVEVAQVVPIATQGQDAAAGFLIVGISPRRVLDEEYRDFLRLAASHVAKAIGDTRALEHQRRRAEVLAELNHTKTTFFSNVSHEFRTPLTLLLGPLEHMLESAGGLGLQQREILSMAHHNALRLLRLVNTLLDFSRVEAGRMQFSPKPTDIAPLTAALAANFQSLCESAGVSLVIDCPALERPVLLDPDSWEKIVLNLLSNAFKFTLAGEIRVGLRAVGKMARLTIADTGCGIPDDELLRIFERFHRIEGQPSRSAEGTGIGLALVQELVKLNGGTIDVASTVGCGTTFTVQVPFLEVADAGKMSTPAAVDQPAERRTAAAYVEEAARWLTDIHQPRSETPVPPVSQSTGQRERILLADDNADMRVYLKDLLSPHWWIEVVPDGQAALQAMRRRGPDLLITDVMMPGLGGLELVAAVRADPALASLSVILLSARAGEARIEGLTAGADDYVVKPFAAQELLARVKATLSLGRLRHHATECVARAEARLRAAIDLVGLSPYSWDPTTDAVEWDDRTRAMWGLSPGAPVDGKVFLSGVHPEDRPRVEAAMARCTDPQGDGIYALEYRVIGIEDGVERWVQTYGRTIFEDHHAVGFIGAVMDITNRKRSEAQLRESEQRFRNFAENINGVLWIADPVTGTIEYMSPAYGRIWGEARDSFEPTLQHWQGTVHPDDVEHAVAAQRRVAQGEVLTYEYRIMRPDGSTRWIRDTSFPIPGQEGRLQRIAGVASDISRQGGAQVYLIGAEHGQGTPLPALLRDAGYEVKMFPSLRTFLEVAPVLVAGCALLDMQTTDRADLQLLRRNRGRQTALPMVMLGAARDDISAAVGAMRAGAADYVPYPFNDRQVADAVASAFTLIEQSVLRSQWDDEAVANVSRLSHRERQVLDGILAGGTNKSIARALGLSPRTVEMHRGRMMEKLGVKTLREAIELAFSAGLRHSTEEPPS